MNYLDDMALAGAALNMTEEQTEAAMDRGDDFDELVFEEFEVSMEQFSNIAQALLKLTPTVKSPLTGKVSHAFGYSKGEGIFVAIVKKDTEDAA